MTGVLGVLAILSLLMLTTLVVGWVRDDAAAGSDEGDR